MFIEHILSPPSIKTPKKAFSRVHTNLDELNDCSPSNFDVPNLVPNEVFRFWIYALFIAEHPIITFNPNNPNGVWWIVCML